MRVPTIRSVSMIAVGAGALLAGLAVPSVANAASHLINGNLITKHSISGAQLRDNTLTGTQINESTLGAVPDATRLGGVGASGYARQVAFTKTTSASAGTFTLFTLQDGGVVTASCTAGVPSQSFTDNNAAPENLYISTTTPGSTSPPAIAGPPFVDHTGFGNSGTQVWVIEGTSTTAPTKSVSLSLTSYATGSGCFWGVHGTSSLAITG